MKELRSLSDHAVVEFLGTVEMFSAFSRAELQQLATYVDSRWYEFGEPVFEIGQKNAGLYVVRSGTVRLFSEESGKEVSQGVRKAGDVLAEIGALREHPHDVAARASAKSEILFLSREAIAPVLANNKDAAAFLSSYSAIRMAGGVVSRLFELKGKVDHNELAQLVRSLGVKRVEAGATILTQGSSDDRRLYVVRQGKVRITRQEEGTEYSIGTARQGEFFGEFAALNPSEQPASVIAETDAVLLVIPTDTLRLLLERKPQIKEFLENRVKVADRELERQKQLAERRGRRLLFDMVDRAGVGESILPRFQLIEQAEEADCGAACLAMICKHYGIAVTLGKLREMANVTTEGATLDSLARVGESLGFTARGMKCTFESMLGFDLPFIAHWEGYHYIVVYGVSKRHVWVADPARGFAKMDVADFEKGWTGTCLLFAPSAGLSQARAGTSPWLRFVGYLKPFKKLIGYIAMATLVIELLGVAPPIIVQNILDRVVVHHNVSLLHVLIVGLIITHVFTRLTTLMRGFLANYIRRNLDFEMISHFFRHTLSLPLDFFNRRRTGDIFARFQENMKVRNFLTESTVSTLLNTLMAFVYFMVMFLYSVKLTLLLMAFMVPMAVLTIVVTPRIKQYARRAFETSTDAESVLMETLSGAETVKAMGIERPMRMRWEGRYAKALEVQYRSQRFDLLVGFTGQLMSAASSVLILWIGASQVLAGNLTIGQLVAFTMLMGSAMAPVMGLIGLWDQLQETGVAMERLGDVLELEPEQKPQEIESRIMLPNLKGDIRFDNVFFRYGGNENRFVLESIRFGIEPGQLVAIVGQSGSGKTTLAKLIAGFYKPTEGSIYVDGYDMNLVEKEYYRAQLGYVMQNNLLFSGTVAENIAAGEENPDRRRVVEVAKMADAHNFISAMPLGYEQLVGERGMGLSGGQVQRLCIARALYHDPRVLILDEATSALDSQSESNILKNMQDVLKGRTSIVIAHRLSTIMNADKILVLYNGSVVEEGVHSELIDRRGMYHQLVQKQMMSVA
ncbi:ABC transporter transmembrane domain-containing protein [Steroidobacter sp.]|uniref:ABC transporter transmembrane domain-containing protein n=1 Tax=Steroidobacter sp. TaxID=1978227 RepID=UPI001A49A755|nr:ABC transporter transmembrane domain-containing protein [Steroidobacter sp.]MBL8267717.1 cyclic nucleotide-binding domain-containing protein [Steroidobacter sp.]